MKLLAIDKLHKKDTLIYYRNQYEGVALFTLIAEKEAAIPFRSSVEIKPTGEREATVELLDSIDYPLIPLIRAIKKEIIDIDIKGWKID